MLSYVALFLIFSLPLLVAAQIVVFGGLPGKIARKRGHPWPEAVNVAGWIGLVTGVFWPVALIWAFLPIPQRVQESSDGTTQPSAEATDLAARVASLEATVNKLQSKSKGGVA
jgi:hypothetical protein